MAIKPLTAVTLESGCFIPLSHSLNHDGYFRKRNGGKPEMFHRTIWRHFIGEIPKGYEVDHICRNRACFNVKHLRLLPRLDHLVHTNETRYADRKESARKRWLSTRMTGAELAEEFGVSFSAGCRWIREWKRSA